MEQREPVMKQYTRDDLTVVWQPDKCIHSTLCWKGLVAVFDPRKRPWINMDGATVEKIIEQVERCPSGALSFFREAETTDANTNKCIDVDTMVEVMHNGPLIVYGNISIKDKNGSVEKKSKVTAFCRCGSSSNKPYCDGTHMKIGFRDE